MDELNLWDSTLEAALKLPIVNVDRANFLSKELKPYCTEENIMAIIDGAKTTTNTLSKDRIERIAQGVINYHLTIVTSTSALAGIPGGWAMAGTIPADLAQFFAHILCMTQKMLYLYGFDDLNDKNGGLTDEAKQILTVFIGLMFGSQAAMNGLKEILAMAAKGVPTQLAKLAITKTTIYQLSKQVAKFIGVKLSKDTFLKGVGKLIPLVGAPISGTLTYFTFKPMAMKLKKYLSGNCL